MVTGSPSVSVMIFSKSLPRGPFICIIALLLETKSPVPTNKPILVNNTPLVIVAAAPANNILPIYLYGLLLNKMYTLIILSNLVSPITIS